MRFTVHRYSAVARFPELFIQTLYSTAFVNEISHIMRMKIGLPRDCFKNTRKSIHQVPASVSVPLLTHMRSSLDAYAALKTSPVFILLFQSFRFSSCLKWSERSYP